MDDDVAEEEEKPQPSVKKLPSQKSSASEEEKQKPIGFPIQSNTQIPTVQPPKVNQPVAPAAETIDLLDL